MTDPVAERDAGVMAAVDAYMYEHDGMVHDDDHPPLFVLAADRWPKVKEPWTETPLFFAKALLSERQRGREEMRDRAAECAVDFTRPATRPCGLEGGGAMTKMAVADGLETTASERAFIRQTVKPGGSLSWKEVAALLRDVNRLLSERHRGEEAMRERKRYRHAGGSMEYEIIAEGHMRAADWMVFDPVSERNLHVAGTPVVVYRGVEGGMVWVLPREEFYDGRFEALPLTLEPTHER